MCLAFPARITRIVGQTAEIDIDGTRLEISLLLLEGAHVDDYVIVHAGFAIHRIDEREAHRSLDLLRAMAALTQD